MDIGKCYEIKFKVPDVTERFYVSTQQNHGEYMSSYGLVSANNETNCNADFLGYYWYKPHGIGITQEFKNLYHAIITELDDEQTKEFKKTLYRFDREKKPNTITFYKVKLLYLSVVYNLAFIERQNLFGEVIDVKLSFDDKDAIEISKRQLEDLTEFLAKEDIGIKIHEVTEVER